MAAPSENWDNHVRRITDLQLGLEGELTGPLPIQAIGTLGGRGFYFHAEHSNWTFEMEDDLGQLPSDTGNNPVFSIAGRWKFADDMTPADARQIITACARLFLATAAQHL